MYILITTFKTREIKNLFLLSTLSCNMKNLKKFNHDLNLIQTRIKSFTLL